MVFTKTKLITTSTLLLLFSGLYPRAAHGDILPTASGNGYIEWSIGSGYHQVFSLSASGFLVSTESSDDCLTCLSFSAMPSSIFLFGRFPIVIGTFDGGVATCNPGGDILCHQAIQFPNVPGPITGAATLMSSSHSITDTFSFSGYLSVTNMQITAINNGTVTYAKEDFAIAPAPEPGNLLASLWGFVILAAVSIACGRGRKCECDRIS